MTPRAQNKNLMKSPLKEQLRSLLQEKSIYRGEFTLASGAKSDFYVDARLTSLDPRGACLIGEVGWELVKETALKLGKRVDAIGGLTMGADPVALSIGIAAQRQDPSTPLHRPKSRERTWPAKADRRQFLAGQFSRRS